MPLMSVLKGRDVTAEDAGQLDASSSQELSRTFETLHQEHMAQDGVAVVEGPLGSTQDRSGAGARRDLVELLAGAAELAQVRAQASSKRLMETEVGPSNGLQIGQVAVEVPCDASLQKTPEAGREGQGVHLEAGQAPRAGLRVEQAMGLHDLEAAIHGVEHGPLHLFFSSVQAPGTRGRSHPSGRSAELNAPMGLRFR